MMFIIRLAAEALSLTERNEQQKRQLEPNGLPKEHQPSVDCSVNSNLENGQERYSPNGKRSETVETSQDHRSSNDESGDGGGGGSSSGSLISPAKRAKLSDLNPVNRITADLGGSPKSNGELDRVKNSILFDLLSGRENLNTACHRSQLFLCTVKGTTNARTTGPHCDVFRRRKPLRPVKNVNRLPEADGSGDAKSECGRESICSIEDPLTELSKMPPADRTPSLPVSYSTKFVKPNGKKTKAISCRLTQVDRGGSRSELHLQSLSGFNFGMGGSQNVAERNIRSGWRRKHTDEHVAEQPLDLSAPKSIAVNSNGGSNGIPGLSTDSVPNKNRRFYDSHVRHQARLIRHSRERGRRRGRFENGTIPVHDEKPACTPFVQPPHVPFSSTLDSFANSISPLIPDLLNLLLQRSSYAMTASHVPALHSSRIYSSSQSNSGLHGSVNTIPFSSTQVYGVAKPVSSQSQSQVQPTRLAHSPPVPNTDLFDIAVKHRDLARIMELYAKHACLRMHGATAVPTQDLTLSRNKLPSDPFSITHHSQTSPHTTTTPRELGVDLTHPCEILPALVRNTHPVLGTAHLPNPVYSAPLSGSVHPLVDRILSTLYALNPPIRSSRECEVLKPSDSPSQESTTGMRLKSNLQIPQSPAICTMTDGSTPPPLIYPTLKQSATSSQNPESLMQLRSDRIFIYLVQFVKHPEALLVDCFNPIRSTPRDSESWWDRSALMHGLSTAAFQLMLRGESDRVQLFLRTWHLLYLLCALERSGSDAFLSSLPDRWQRKPPGSQHERIQCQSKVDALKKLRRWTDQLNMSSQMYSLIRGVILCQGTRIKVDVDAVLQQCMPFLKVNQSNVSTSVQTSSLSANGQKLTIFKKVLHKLCTFHRDFIRELFVSASSTQAVEFYIENWIQNG